MPTSTMNTSMASMQSQLQLLEKGLQGLKNSKVQTMPEFKSMYGAAESHYQQLRLSHLTGKSREYMEHAEQDSKFYFILTKMLNEVSSQKSKDRKNYLYNIHAWYLNNRHVLHSGPRFGPSRKEPVTREFSRWLAEQKMRPGSGCSLQLSLPNLHDLPPEQQDPPICHAANESPTQKTVIEKEEEPEATMTPEPSPPPLESLLPKKKTPPLSHVFNPLSQAFEEMEAFQEQYARQEATRGAPLSVHVGRPDQNPERSSNPEVRKKALLQKFHAFKQDFHAGQEELSQWQHMGRGGIVGTSRYAAHDRGVAAEDMTPLVLANYAAMTEQIQPPTGPSPYNTMMKETLEDFYETANKYYPLNPPRTPYHSKSRQTSAKLRKGSATGRTETPPNRVSSAKRPRKGSAHSSTKTSRPSSAAKTTTSSRNEGSESSIQFSNMVNMIDSVREELTHFKEKILPDPKAGFRQPTTTFDPTARPQTAPPGSRARPSTPAESTLRQWAEVPPFPAGGLDGLGGGSSLPSVRTPQPITAAIPIREAIDWRGKIEPESRKKWKDKSFAAHTYLKKRYKPQSARPPSGRAQTAPILMSDRWGSEIELADNPRPADQAATHSTTEVPEEAMEEFMQIMHLGGGDTRTRSPLYEESSEFSYLFSDMEPYTAPTPQQLEYLSFCTSLSKYGVRLGTMGPSSGNSNSFIDSGVATGSYMPGYTSSYGDYGLSVGTYDAGHDGDLDSVTGGTGGQIEKTKVTPDGLSSQHMVKQERHQYEGESSNDQIEATISDSVRLVAEVNQLVRDHAHNGSVDQAGGGDDITYNLVADTRRETDYTPEHAATLVEHIHGEDNSGIEVAADFVDEESDQKETQAVQFDDSALGRQEQGWNNRRQADTSAQDVYNAFDDEKFNVEAERFLRKRLLARPKTTPAQVKLTPGFKQRFYTRSFPKKPTWGITNDEIEDINVAGTSVASQAAELRMRTAGKAPARAKSSGHADMLQRQQEMLHRAPARAPNTAPSIPGPHSAYGTRSPRHKTYIAELELHARRVNSPRMYMDRVNGLRAQDSMSNVAAEQDLMIGQGPHEVRLKISTLRGHLNKSPATPPLSERQPGTPPVSLVSGPSPEPCHTPKHATEASGQLTASPRPEDILKMVGQSIEPLPGAESGRDSGENPGHCHLTGDLATADINNANDNALSMGSTTLLPRPLPLAKEKTMTTEINVIEDIAGVFEHQNMETEETVNDEVSKSGSQTEAASADDVEPATLVDTHSPDVKDSRLVVTASKSRSDNRPSKCKLQVEVPTADGKQTDGKKTDGNPTPPASKPRRLVGVGRPIPDYAQVQDPDDYSEAVKHQKEIQSAVDIQRIFRGYVARNHYKYLQKEVREKREDEQKAAVHIQRSYRGHLERKRTIYDRSPDPTSAEWAKQYDKKLAEKEYIRRGKAGELAYTNSQNKARADAKISIIGPHVDVYQPFHPKKTGPDKALLTLAATIIQKWARGYITRNRFERMRRKAKYHAGSWNKFINQYKELLRRVQVRLGNERPKAPFSFPDVNEYMDQKKRYESVFEKRAFGSEIDTTELMSFFKECELYPSQSEIDESVDAVFRGQSVRQTRGLHKHEVLEIAFQIYPPRGTGIVNTRKSTWLNPIIDGEEAVKLVGTDNVEETTFKACWDLVCSSQRYRKDKQKKKEQEEQAEKDRVADEQRKKKEEQEKKERREASQKGSLLRKLTTGRSPTP